MLLCSILCFTGNIVTIVIMGGQHDGLLLWGHPHITSSSRGGGRVASLMTTDDKGEGGVDRTDDVIKTVIL